MKKRLLPLLMILALCNVGFSQQKDNGQPLNVQTQSSSIEKGGGSIGLFCNSNLGTPLVTDNANAGIMFDVQVINTIVISGLEINVDATFNDDVTIYFRVGTHVGFEGSAVGWTNVGTANLTAVATGNALINLPLNLEASPGVVSFYIHRSLAGINDLNYSNGTAVGNTLASDANVSIKEGTGIGDIFGGTFTPRNFEGVMHYCIPKPLVCVTTTTELNNVNGNSGIFFDVSATANPIEIEQIYCDFPASFNEINVKLYSRTGSHVGFENSLVGWTLHLDNTLLTTQVVDAPFAIGNTIGIEIPAGSTRGFYVFADAVGVDYTDDADPVGTPCNTDPNLIIRTGGGSSTLFGGLEFSPRNFNGIIDYCFANVGLDEIGSSSVQLFPNPTNNDVMISVKEGKIVEIQIVDLLGKNCMSQYLSNGLSETSMDVSSLKNGAYFVTVKTSSNQVITTKLIKK